MRQIKDNPTLQHGTNSQKMPEVLQLVGAYEVKTDTVRPLFLVNYEHKKEVTIQMESAIVYV